MVVVTAVVLLVIQDEGEGFALFFVTLPRQMHDAFSNVPLRMMFLNFLPALD